MEQNRAVGQATTSGRIDDLQSSIQQQRIHEIQRSTNLQAELAVLRQQQQAQSSQMNTRADELMSTLREQLKAIKQDLDAERE